MATLDPSAAELEADRPSPCLHQRHPMIAITPRPAAWRRQVICWLAAAVLGAVPTAAVAQSFLDFEGIPASHHYDGGGLNLGGYYAGQPGGPTFGPQATVLEVGGSVNHLLYPPKSGTATLWGEGLDLELTFTTALAQSVSLYYRSNADVFLFAYDALNALLGSTSGPASLGGDPEGLLDFTAPGPDYIARVLIVGPAGAFVIDDVAYLAVPVVPEPAHVALLCGLGLLAFAAWRRRI